jgi:hypothetical protein
MILTNAHKLPESVMNALNTNYKPKEGRISVTDLVNPPLIRHLRLKHWDNIQEDASDKLWMLLGTSLHYVLEQHSPEDAFEEEKLTHDIVGITISGKSDLYHNEVVTDWKTTSVYSFLLGIKPEWEAQLNVYAWLWEKNGFPVKELWIYAILRDWSKTKSQRERDYPPIPFTQIRIPLWDIGTTERYILNRIKLHQQEPPPECTPEEKWARPTKYALMKRGRKSAVKLYDSKLEALTESDFKGNDYYVIDRLGENIRCKGYCNVAKFCPYYKDDEGGE